MAWFELARVRTEFFHSLVIPSLTPHPVQSNRQAPRHRDLGDLPASAHWLREQRDGKGLCGALTLSD